MEKSKNSFTSGLGFVLSAAASAVGLGNIWRFPYLAAKDGGGLFLIIYLILSLTFGYTMLISEVAIGRRTKKASLFAYGEVRKNWKFLGALSFIIPAIILPYYCVIGGWVMKYASMYFSFNGSVSAADGFFGGFISGKFQPIFYCILFLIITISVVYKGVQDGVEKVSGVMLPVLCVLIIVISVYCLFIKMDDGNGNVRTGFQGLAVYIIPNFKGLTFTKLMNVFLDAVGQLFYSLSIAMGIMVTYGSYMTDEITLDKSVKQIEVFDTGVAFLAGLMIIPAVFVFSGLDGMGAGPGLMFVVLPKVFNSLGFVGEVVGFIFFIAVLLAALTSSISLSETLVACIMEKFNISRKKATLICFVYCVIVAVIVCLGYNLFYFEKKLPNGSTAQLLDVLDYFSNNIFMPVLAILTCVMIGWFEKPKSIIEEVQRNGEDFRRKKTYVVMVKYIAPVLLFVILFQAFGVFK